MEDKLIEKIRNKINAHNDGVYLLESRDKAEIIADLIPLHALLDTHHIIPKDDLIVLDEGEVPKFGDVVLWEKFGRISKSEVCQWKNKNFDWEYFRGKKYEGGWVWKIITRNGVPVIYRGKMNG